MAPPLVSVALLVKDGLPLLARVLDALTIQETPWPFEMVALDSGSSDGSVERMETAGVRVHRIAPERFSFGEARDRCFALTRGQVIVTLSQDAVPLGSTWLKDMAQPILDGAWDVVVGGEERPQTGTFFWELQGGFYFASPYGGWPFEAKRMSCVCLSIRRETWECTGFGPAPMNEDKRLAQRLLTIGARIRVTDHPRVLHGHQYDLVSLAKRCFNEGMGARATGGRYGIPRMVVDMAKPKIWARTITFALQGRIRRPAELLFFAVRPLMLWIGFRFGRGYWR